MSFILCGCGTPGLNFQPGLCPPCQYPLFTCQDPARLPRSLEAWHWKPISTKMKTTQEFVSLPISLRSESSWEKNEEVWGGCLSLQESAPSLSCHSFLRPTGRNWLHLHRTMNIDCGNWGRTFAKGNSRNTWLPATPVWGTCSLTATQWMTSVLEIPLRTRILMGSVIQYKRGSILAGKPGVTSSLAYPMWDYSACKSSIYLLRKGRSIFHMLTPGWQRSKHCTALPISTLAVALPAKLLWWLGGTPGGWVRMGEPPAGSCRPAESHDCHSVEWKAQAGSLRTRLQTCFPHMPQSGPDLVSETGLTNSQKLPLQECLGGFPAFLFMAVLVLAPRPNE